MCVSHCVQRGPGPGGTSQSDGEPLEFLTHTTDVKGRMSMFDGEARCCCCVLCTGRILKSLFSFMTSCEPACRKRKETGFESSFFKKKRKKGLLGKLSCFTGVVTQMFQSGEVAAFSKKQTKLKQLYKTETLAALTHLTSFSFSPSHKRCTTSGKQPR